MMIVCANDQELEKGRCLLRESAVIHPPQVQDQLSGVFSGQCRHRDDCVRDAAPQSLQAPPGPRQVHLVGHDGMRSEGELRAVLVELEAQLLELNPGLRARHVQHIQQDTAALDVPQETHTQATVQMSSGDQPGNISH